MTGAVITGSFVMGAVGAFYLLEGRMVNYARSSWAPWALFTFWKGGW